MTKVEEVAKALAESVNGGDFWDDRWYADDHRKLWMKRARAAIEAMRIPSEGMVEAGAEAIAWKNDKFSEDARDAWQAMLTAALGETDDHR